MGKGLREVKVVKDVLRNPLGSCIISFGETKVLCSCSRLERLPKFLQNQGKGWISAEYCLMPTSTNQRTQREAVRGKQQGRTIEIQRLISRSLRSSVDLKQMKDINLMIDCDVLEADGGTRCASITGGFIALEIAIHKLMEEGVLKTNPIIDRIAAVSVGVVNEEVILDLDYELDSNAQVDMNVVMTETGKFIELQGTGEEYRYSRDELNQMLDKASVGIKEIFNVTK